MKENSSAEEHWEVWKTAFEVFAWVKQFKCLKDDQNLCNTRYNQQKAGRAVNGVYYLDHGISSGEVIRSKQTETTRRLGN